MRRRAALEQERKKPIFTANLATHFSRFNHQYIIMSPSQVFTLDETGLSTITISHGKAKSYMNAAGRKNLLDLSFASNSDHIFP